MKQVIKYKCGHTTTEMKIRLSIHARKHNYQIKWCQCNFQYPGLLYKITSVTTMTTEQIKN
jgi:hypothetical protein